MKRILAVVVIWLVAWCGVAQAVELDDMTIDELITLRDSVSTRIGEMLKTEDIQRIGIEGAIPIKEIFPDKAFAKFVRDTLGKISIDQPVTQMELDTITSFMPAFLSDGDYTDFTGIGRLRNLDDILFGNGRKYVGKTLPDEFYTLTALTRLDLSGCQIEIISDLIANLQNLQSLDLSGTKLSEFPSAVCEISSLKYLDISRTNISRLPDNIGSLSALKTLDISRTPISTLPDSIYALTLEKFDKTGTTIE